MPSTKKVQIIIEAEAKVDRATKEVRTKLDALQGKVKSMGPAFKKMALVGTASFIAIGAGIGSAVKSAGDAEGALAKFQTVFGENTEEMTKFVDKLRQEMPTARHEIVRMSADLQDLLIPLGLSREKATGLTQGFLDLANKISAFNDVDPSSVIEAFRSGLSGSSEPLRRYGINALETTLELEAMNSGLLESGQKFKDIDPILKSQIRAQALLSLAVKQSSDAIEGFAINQDSFIRRSQEMRASMTDIKVEIGTAFLPIIDDLLKKLLPVVAKFGDWAEENPELLRTLITVALSLAGMLATLGFMGLAFGPIVKGIKGMTTAVVWLTTSAMGPWLVILGSVATAIILINESIKKFQGLTGQITRDIKRQEEEQDKVAKIIAEKEARGEDVTKLKTAQAQALEGTAELKRFQGGSFADKVFFSPKEDAIMNAEEANGKRNIFNFNFNGDITDKGEFMEKIKRHFTEELSIKQVIPQ